MAINVNRPDFSGLAQRSGTPKLSVPGGLGLQGLQLTLQEREALRRQALEEAKIRSADERALMQKQIERAKLAQGQSQFEQAQDFSERELALNQQKAAAAQQRFGARLGMDQKEYGLDAQRLEYQRRQAEKQQAFEQMKMGVEQLAEKKKEDLDRMGAFATSAKLAMSQVTDPTEANILRNQIIDESVNNGMIAKDMGKHLKRQPLPAFKRFLDTAVVQTDSASKYKSLRDAGKETVPGTFKFTTENGDVIEYQAMTDPTRNKIQKKAVGIEQELESLDSLTEKLDKKYLTYRGQAGASLGQMAEKAEDIPIVGAILNKSADIVSGMDDKERNKFIQDMQAFANQTFQVFNKYRMRTTGMQAAFAELQQIQSNYLSGDMSFNQYVGSLREIVRQNKEELNLLKSQLKKGVNVTETNDKPLSEMTDAELLEAYQNAQ